MMQIWLQELLGVVLALLHAMFVFDVLSLVDLSMQFQGLGRREALARWTPLIHAASEVVGGVISDFPDRMFWSYIEAIESITSLIPASK